LRRSTFLDETGAVAAGMYTGRRGAKSFDNAGATMRTLGFVVLLLASVSAHGQWRDRGEIVPDNEWRKSAGTFGAQLDFTAKPDELFAAWNKPGTYVNIPASTNTAHRGEVIMGVVFFTGCKPDDKGNCQATVDYLTLRPDSTVYGDLKDGDLWKGKPAPTGSAIQLCAQTLGLRIEPTDPLGEYTVRATIHDLNAGATIELTRKFRVEAVEPQKPKP